MNLIEALTDLLSVDKPHVIAIDGPAGSGKSTLAKELFLYFSTTYDVNLLGLDDIYDGWQDALGQKLTEDLSMILTAHKEENIISVDIYDWTKFAYREKREIQPKEILIIEGVGSAQAITRAHKAITIWMDIDPHQGFQRVLERDGHHISEEMKKWLTLQNEHFLDSGAKENADFVISAA
jgi:uridine kinase